MNLHTHENQKSLLQISKTSVCNEDGYKFVYIRRLNLDALPGNPCRLIQNLCLLHVAFTHEGQKKNNGEIKHTNFTSHPRPVQFKYTLLCVIWGKWGGQLYWILQDTAYIYQHTAHIIFNKLKRRNASSNFSSCYNPFFPVEIWDFHVVFTTHQIFTFPSALSLVSAALTNHCNIRHVSFVHHPWYLDPSYFIPNCTPALCFN